MRDDDRCATCRHHLDFAVACADPHHVRRRQTYQAGLARTTVAPLRRRRTKNTRTASERAAINPPRAKAATMRAFRAPKVSVVEPDEVPVLPARCAYDDCPQPNQQIRRLDELAIVAFAGRSWCYHRACQRRRRQQLSQSQVAPQHRRGHRRR